ncbi:MAG TPA: hypothetical protein VER55_02490, partial [Ardenticatenaceae bacterium]|nr:hypothetical protein [Ardenticatenaceae bacterium]
MQGAEPPCRGVGCPHKNPSPFFIFDGDGDSRHECLLNTRVSRNARYLHRGATGLEGLLQRQGQRQRLDA